MGQTQSLAPRPPRATRYGVFFERDNAGLSNVRLQLESLFAICVAHHRFLVLPEATESSHLTSGPFHEKDLWDLTLLSTQVPLVLWDSRPAPAMHTVDRPLETVELASLPRDQHWFFPRKTSRICHFECLRYESDAAREAAVEAVLRGFEIHTRHHALGHDVLARLGLRKGGYAAAHLRRGDFKAFRPSGYLSQEALVEALERLARHRALLVVTDAGPEDVAVHGLRDHLSIERVCFPSDVYPAGAAPYGSLARAACDVLLCRWAAKFVGTVDSTFSLWIMGARVRDALTNALSTSLTTPEFLTAQAPLEQCSVGSPSWNKLTTFSRR